MFYNIKYVGFLIYLIVFLYLCGRKEEKALPSLGRECNEKWIDLQT